MNIERRLFLIATAISAFGLAGLNSMAEAQNESPVKLGLLMPFSGFGSISAVNHASGVRAAVAEINQAGGIAGRQVQVIEADDQSDPTQTVTQAQRLISDARVDAILGPILSQQGMAIGPILTKAGIPNFSTNGTTQLTPKFAPYHFSFQPSSRAQGIAMIDYISTALGAKSAAILADTGAQARDAVIEMKKYLQEKGIALTGEQEFQPKTADFTPQLLSLQRGNPDAVLLFAPSSEDVGNILKARMDLGWTAPVAGGSTVGIATASAVQIAGEAGFDGVTGTSFKAWTYCATDSAKTDTPAFMEFVEKLRKQEGKRFDDIDPSAAAAGYVSVYLYKAAVEGAGSTAGPDVAAWITKNVGSWPNLYGPLTANDETHHLIGSNLLAQVAEPYNVREGDGFQRRADCH
ncbi:amino acid ABC transporter substrate-binding protein (plasmid) [Rhizobium gallicum]|uniref:Amino acid ABC transporter substrate-binding protein n=2 Tax=Rhizobium gallicum TaxID=56730 RepID=A0A1L5NS35_9HYPH|nr:amino acid ABC transporter substrate-binding protein [Rhizobium gallicum]